MKKIPITKISWIDHQWFVNEEIKLPIIDRGLALCDGIFETILIYDSKPQLLDAHLHRWQKSAKDLGMALPPPKSTIVPLLEEALVRATLKNGLGSLRLNWSRGNNDTRGIDFPHANDTQPLHKFWLEINNYHQSFSPLTTKISHKEKRNADSKLSQHKTFAYLQSIQARYEANLGGYNEALLLSTNGEICCGTTANLIILRKNEWLTPRSESGCLPGIMRQQGLKLGIFKEAKILPKPERNDQWLLINSLSCHSLIQVNTVHLKEYHDAEILWRSLLEKAT